MSKRYRLSDPAQLDAEELFDYVTADDFDTVVCIESELFEAVLM